MKAIYYHTNCYQTKPNSSRYAGEADEFVTDLFFSFLFGAYSIYIWELGGGILSGVTALISILCLLRAIYLMTEWLRDVIHLEENSIADISANTGCITQKSDGLRSGKKKKFISRRFNMAGH